MQKKTAATIKPHYKFVVVSHPALLDFEREIENRINDGWELSGELIVTPRQFDPKKKRDDTYLHYSQPMIRPYLPEPDADSEPVNE